jgi:anti-sigma B factor antagonist
MKIEIEHPHKGQVVVRPKGRIDAESAPNFKERLQQIAKEDTDLLVVDLEAVNFIDSSGLSALVSGLKALRQHGGSLSLSRPQPQALKALRLTLLDRVFPIYTSVDQALSEGDLLKP